MDFSMSKALLQWPGTKPVARTCFAFCFSLSYWLKQTRVYFREVFSLGRPSFSCAENCWNTLLAVYNCVLARSGRARAVE